MKKCTVIDQGYPTVSHQVDCLSHTGSALWPFLVLGLMLLIAGTIIYLSARSHG